MRSMRPLSYWSVWPLLGALAVGMIGCGCCCITGGGSTTRADPLDDVHKEAEIGIGGPGWWLMRHLGVRFIKDEDVAATLAINGIHSIQVSSYILDDTSESRQREILELYAEPLRNKGWELLSRVQEDQKRVAVYAQVDEDSFRGIFVVVFESDRMNVVKISGDIRPEMFADLNVRLGPLRGSLPVEASDGL